MSKAIRATVHAALTAALSYGESIDALRVIYKGQTTEAIRAALLPEVAAFHKFAVPLVAGAGKAVGRLVLDKEHANYEACRKALGRLVSAIVGKSDNKSEETEEIEIPAELLAAAAKLAKLAQEYEGARALAARALAQVFAK